jgi:disulfide bond formation protein DsbB
MTIPNSNNSATANRDQAGVGLLALAAILALTLLAGAACGGGGQPSSADPAVQQGQKIFGRLCATCHGRDAKGMRGLGKSLIANAFTKSLSDQELVEFLQKGRAATDPLNETGVDMPPKGGDPTLTTEDLQHVVAYLRTL